MGVLTLTLIAVGCKSNVGSVLSTIIRKVFLPISETLPTASVCLTLEMNATWQYSVNNGNDFVNGTGSSFMLADNTTYAANAIQVRQTDAVGNVSDTGKNTLRIVVDNTDPTFDLQPTAINVMSVLPCLKTILLILIEFTVPTIVTVPLKVD
jgi:hypothetical protein